MSFEYILRYMAHLSWIWPFLRILRFFKDKGIIRIAFLSHVLCAYNALKFFLSDSSNSIYMEKGYINMTYLLIIKCLFWSNKGLANILINNWIEKLVAYLLCYIKYLCTFFVKIMISNTFGTDNITCARGETAWTANCIMIT